MERWIGSGEPIQLDGPPSRRRGPESPLGIALDRSDQALVFLLLCNGYDPNLESESPLNRALRSRRWDLLDLLLEWGADPKRVELSDLFGTYSSKLWERFHALGVDLTAGHALAEALAYHTSNKPLFGFAKRHREDIAGMQQELNIALVHHAGEGNEKGVQLCLWAGADPHAPAHTFRSPEYLYQDESDLEEEDRFAGFSAVCEACLRGEAEILERLRPDPARDDFNDLFKTAANRRVVAVLARFALPKNVGRVITRQLFWSTLPLGLSRSTDTVRSIFEAGARLQSATPEEITSVRRTLLKVSDYDFEELVKFLATGDYCSPEILKELARTPKMRERMRKVGFIPLPSDDPNRYSQRRPTRSKEVLSKFGIELPKEKPRLPRLFEIGTWRYGAEELRFTREEFFDRVWSEPVEQLARSWGLSGRGLAKACEKIRVPVPPRGYWAKLRAGRRAARAKLPGLAPGEIETVVVRLSKP